MERLIQLKFSKLIFLYFNLIFFSISFVNAQISGTVFRDFNGNGIKDNSVTFNEVGVGGVAIKAYDAAGSQVGSETSATDGSYSFTGLTLPLGLSLSAAPSNASKVRVTAGMTISSFNSSIFYATKVDNMFLTSSTPASSCSLTSITTTPGTCNPSNNQYTLTGTVTFVNPPATGTLMVSVSGGGSQVFTAPFTSPQAYSIANLTSDGVSHTVTVSFSADAACTANTTYTAPASCYCTPSCLLSASFFQDVILGFDGTTYSSEGQGTNGSCTLDGAYDMAIGPDGNLYISSSITNTILKFDISTVSCLGTFVSAGSGGLDNPRGLTFLPNGDLLVNSHNSGKILRYNGTTGAFIGVFSSGSDISPLASMSPHMNVKVGPDGAVWVADHTNNRILRFDATTGAFLSVFAQLPAGSGVRSFEFVGSTVLISRHNADIVAAYDYNTGAYISDFADAADGLDGPTGITYGPDGKIYIGSLNTNQILVFDASGAKLQTIAVNSPKDILFKCGDCFSATCMVSNLTAVPGTCNAINNQYDLTGTVTFSNAPISGIMTVSVSGGGSQTFTAPFTSPQNYSIAGLVADGASHTVTVSFSADAACTNTTTYTAPSNCTTGCSPIPCGSTTVQKN